MRQINNIIILGAGSVLELYAPNLKRLDVVKYVYDKCFQRMQKACQLYGFKEFQIENLSSFTNNSIILDITSPEIHFEMNKKLLSDHFVVFSEKPCVTDRSELSALKILIEKGDFILAPDNHLSPYMVEVKKFIEEHTGKIRNVQCVYQTQGHERWHPRPWIYYTKAGGVVSDIFPYFSRCLTTLFDDYVVEGVSGKLGEHSDFFDGENKYKSMKVPVLVDMTLRLNNGVVVPIYLDFQSKNNVSCLSIETDNFILEFDPVDSGTAVKLFDKEHLFIKELVPASEDLRGQALFTILSKNNQDPYFNPKTKNFKIIKEQENIINITERLLHETFK